MPRATIKSGVKGIMAVMVRRSKHVPVPKYLIRCGWISAGCQEHASCFEVALRGGPEERGHIVLHRSDSEHTRVGRQRYSVSVNGHYKQWHVEGKRKRGDKEAAQRHKQGTPISHAVASLTWPWFVSRGSHHYHLATLT